ncbi:histidine phosphatase family protein [Phytomonospora endophytica]|uniref:Putative phosphoglycerate mutase n=1 Tax=Phytomonospora endophytica TaxID=714109 RepID=A0A841FQ11_9ACTN|nr:histidine phosphatase family protein [Phytomonospora endophytica]MBB6034040.1 putative phosphoglycerate mutase [Phytomonospora endophytica]GIG71576.1 phosphoglycerate mutase [Phytomonospora endophytica]
MTRLLIVRHGQTSWNGSRRFQGWTDIELDEVGREQALRAAVVLAAQNPDLIVASDLSRAVSTAQAVADLTGQAVVTDERLRERGYGPWEGLTMPEIGERWPAEHDLWRAGRPVALAGIETWDELKARTGAAMAEIVEKVGDGTAVVACHGGSARQAVAAVLGWDAEMTNTIHGLDNCHWADVRLSRGWRLHAYNVGAQA